jgi:hypothetical protein
MLFSILEWGPIHTQTKSVSAEVNYRQAIEAKGRSTEFAI